MEQNHSGSGDNVAGDKVNITFNISDFNINELVEIFKLKAEKIKQQLKNKRSRLTKKFLNQFEELHIKHINALIEKKLVLAHEILRTIYQLLNDYNLRNSFLGLRIKPGVMYHISHNAFDSFSKNEIEYFPLEVNTDISVKINNTNLPRIKLKILKDYSIMLKSNK